MDDEDCDGMDAILSELGWEVSLEVALEVEMNDEDTRGEVV